ncbi:MAG TPA: hypothetical protein VGN86_03730 [Pyrinomonadaceae bacterium]|jgi:hypothetical protein|nr:hypothetical protein [Pyrinomonadaceae bacterium]
MKRTFIFSLALLSLTILIGKFDVTRGVNAETVKAPQTIDFDSDRWEIKDPTAKKEEHLGRKSLFLSANGYAALKDVEFEDGIVEVDIAALTPVAFPGVVFRYLSPAEHELVYIRPQHSGHDDATQYVPAFMGSHPWQIYNGKGATVAVEIPREQWFHMKIEVTGLTAKVWFGTAAEPALIITDLKRGYSKGSVGITCGAMGAYFSNFSYSTATPGPHAQPSYPEPRAGTLTSWELSDVFDTQTTSPEQLPAAPVFANMKWLAVKTETPGMVVIDRYRKSPELVPPFGFNRAVRLDNIKGAKGVFARASITSDRNQVVKMSFGYSDEATIFLNRQPIFTGKSAWRFRDQDFNGIMDVEHDAVYLPLKKGKNELVLSVKEYFGGWGFICRLESLSGLSIR